MVRKKLDFFKSMDKMITEVPVSEIMVRNIKTLRETDSVQDVLDLMAEYSISGLLIVDKKGLPEGIVSEGDLIKKVFHTGKDPKKILVKDVMSRHLFTIRHDVSIGEAMNIMKKHEISKLPVVENEQMIGYVTKADLLEKLNEIYYQNTRLKYLPIIVMMQLILIAILVVAYVNK